MYVCICRSVTDTAIRRAIDDGAFTVDELGRKTGAGTQCGSCVPLAREILDRALEARGAPGAQARALELRVACSR